MRTVPATAAIPEKRTAHRTMLTFSHPLAERYTEPATNNQQTLARRVLEYRFMRAVESPNDRPEWRGAEGVGMQTGRAIPRPLQADG
jgi:hypothetical protein